MENDKLNNNHVCPNCGHCTTCGRRNNGWYPEPYYPIYPYYPYNPYIGTINYTTYGATTATYGGSPCDCGTTETKG